MKSLKLNSFEISKAVVPLGVQGENGTRYVYYDATELIEDLGAGTFSYYFQPEGIPAYPMSETWRSGNNLCVTLTSSDMAVAGKGFLQFVYRPNSPTDGAMKTAELAAFIAPALGDGGDVPDPWETYLDRMESAADRAEAAAAGVENPVSYAPQTLTPAQQQQATENIGLGDVKTSKINYTDALTLEEIEASTSLDGKIPTASAVKDLDTTGQVSCTIVHAGSPASLVIKKRNKVCVFGINYRPSSTLSQGVETLIATIPAGYRPYGESVFNVFLTQASGIRTLASIKSDGSFTLYPVNGNISTSDFIRMQFVWMTT